MISPKFGLNGNKLFANVAKPCKVFLNFIVDAANGNGWGVRSIKSNGYVEAVFMHTSATPAVQNGHMNPNPAAGFCVIQMKQCFNHFLGISGGFVTPVATATKLDNAALVVGQAYVIGIVGNATDAQWRACGVPAGIPIAVGVSFIAIATGSGTGDVSTSRVYLPTTSGIQVIEVVGNSVLNAPVNSLTQGGTMLLVQFSAATSSSVTTLIPTAPAASSVCGLELSFDGSSVTIDGV